MRKTKNNGGIMTVLLFIAEFFTQLETIADIQIFLDMVS